ARPARGGLGAGGAGAARRCCHTPTERAGNQLPGRIELMDNIWETLRWVGGEGCGVHPEWPLERRVVRQCKNAVVAKSADGVVRLQKCKPEIAVGHPVEQPLKLQGIKANIELLVLQKVESAGRELVAKDVTPKAGDLENNRPSPGPWDQENHPDR